MLLAIGFGIIALLLAAVGFYGVLAYAVARRRKEIGIHLALGSGTETIFRLILWQGIRILLIDFLVGIVGTLALQRYVASLLYGVVRPLDPTVLFAGGRRPGCRGARGLCASGPAGRPDRSDRGSPSGTGVQFPTVHRAVPPASRPCLLRSSLAEGPLLRISSSSNSPDGALQSSSLGSIGSSPGRLSAPETRGRGFDEQVGTAYSR